MNEPMGNLSPQLADQIRRLMVQSTGTCRRCHTTVLMSYMSAHLAVCDANRLTRKLSELDASGEVREDCND